MTSLMRYTFRRTARTLRNPLKLSRIRWFTLGWVVAIGTTAMGAGFAVAGEHILRAKGVFAMYVRMPGGLHLHGVVMFVLGVALIAGLSGPLFGQPEPRPFLMGTMKLTSYYYCWSWILLLLAPLASNGELSFVGVVTWLMIAFMPALLGWTSPPPEVIPRDETQLLRASLDAGLSPQQASAVVEGFFRGGPGEAE